MGILTGYAHNIKKLGDADMTAFMWASECFDPSKPDINCVEVWKMSAAKEASYVISVSLEAGCYRHIQISSKATLLDLHKAILAAFEFDDDHAHAFFMDNKMWSDGAAYYCDMIEEEEHFTSDHTLGEVILSADMKFKYVFDFGDEWTFQCKVLKTIEKNTEEPIIVRTKGEAPSQYGYDDEFDDEESEEEEEE